MSDMTTNQSRRGFLAYLGLAGAATAATAVIVAPAVEVPASAGHFKHPAEYLAAMQAIGWQPRAMYQRLDDGSAHRMGVNESTTPGVSASETWSQFHAISMRTPIQRPSDYPAGDWWTDVWQHLYDRGFREDVTLDRPGVKS
jgi:hypothetical protein